MLNDRNNTVWLCQTPFSKDNQNVLTFPDRGSQAQYFLSSYGKTFLNISYVRNDIEGGKSYLVVPISFNQALKYNYIMYKNNTENRYYFAFISGCEHKNETVTKLFIEYDVFQNWQFDVIYKPSYIERETVLSDTYNTLADSVAHGQLVETDKKQIIFSGGYFVFCSADPTQDVTTDTPPYAFKIGNYSIPCLTLFYYPHEVAEMSKTLQRIANYGWGDRIMSCVYVPFVNPNIVINGTETTHPKVGFMRILEEIDKGYMSTQVEYPIPVTGYLKKNTYPYSKIQIQDTITGQTVDFAPEKFSGGVAKFEVRGTVSESPYYRIIPMNYEGQFYAYDKAMVVKCDTTLATSNNLYAKYLMQNKSGNDLARMGSVISGAMSIASGVPSVAVTGSISTFQSLASISNQENQASMLGNSITNGSDGAQERVNRSFGFDIKFYTLDSEHNQMSNDYWKMFGYPVRRVKVPTIKGGRYNYVKLGQANITGIGVPVDQLTKFKNLYIMGVTHWHNISDYLNY